MVAHAAPPILQKRRSTTADFQFAMVPPNVAPRKRICIICRPAFVNRNGGRITPDSAASLMAPVSDRRSCRLPIACCMSALPIHASQQRNNEGRRSLRPSDPKALLPEHNFARFKFSLDNVNVHCERSHSAP